MFTNAWNFVGVLVLATELLVEEFEKAAVVEEVQ